MVIRKDYEKAMSAEIQIRNQREEHWVEKGSKAKDLKRGNSGKLKKEKLEHCDWY
jgi:hypothetical protein